MVGRSGHARPSLMTCDEKDQSDPNADAHRHAWQERKTQRAQPHAENDRWTDDGDALDARAQDAHPSQVAGSTCRESFVTDSLFRKLDKGILTRVGACIRLTP